MRIISSLLGSHGDISRNQTAAAEGKKLNNPQADDELSILCVGERVVGDLILGSPVSWCFVESAESTLVSESVNSSHDNRREVDEAEAAGANTSTDSAEGNSGSAAKAAHVDTDEKEEETVEEEDSRPL